MPEQDVSTVVEQDGPMAAGEDVTSATEGTEVAEVAEATSAIEGTEVAEVAEVAETLVVVTEDGDGTAPTEGSGESPKGSRPATKRSTALEREGEVAADFLEQLLDIADMDGDIDVDVDGDRAAVAIVDSEEGRVSRRLVGPDGKVLEALQELTRLAVQAATGERSRLMLDVAGHRAQRRAALVTIAEGAIATVQTTGASVAMDPMTAFERKVVHDTVLAAGLRSESEDVEPNRHVVILPA